MKNKGIGAKVIVKEITLRINPKEKWVLGKNLPGTIVENKGYEQYYHTCSGGHTHVSKHLITNDCFKTYAVKLDNNVVDIEGNNIIVVRDFNLKFVETVERKEKTITEEQYQRALKIIDKYKQQNNLQ